MNKKRTAFLLTLTVLWALLLPVTASADMGPKPSVTVTFQGLEGERYYATLLSSQESTGPWSAGSSYSGKDEETDREAWEKFKNYPEKNGDYFLGFFEDCTVTHTLSWGYYPPGEFRILLYFPEYGTFADSGETMSRYAFSSQFTADLSGTDLFVSTQGQMEVERSGGVGGSPGGFAVRVLLTIALELLIGLLFHFRKARQIGIICLTNLVTQAALNAALDLTHYYQGFWLFTTMPAYFLLELAVWAVECAVYRKSLPRYGEEGRRYHPCWYAAVANAASFAVGLALAAVWPRLF